MTEFDTGGAADAVAALDTEAARRSAEAMADAFDVAGGRISRSLEQAARSGELSFSSLAESVLSDLARIAVSEIVEAPLNAMVDRLGAVLGGARAGGSATVNLSVPGAADPDAFQRSEGQIAGALARAVALGQRRG
ncbi:MAG: phage tail tape measure C-terminal domain-containing protein [Litorimonas sp.]